MKFSETEKLWEVLSLFSPQLLTTKEALEKSFENHAVKYGLYLENGIIYLISKDQKHHEKLDRLVDHIDSNPENLANITHITPEEMPSNLKELTSQVGQTIFKIDSNQNTLDFLNFMLNRLENPSIRENAGYQVFLQALAIARLDLRKKTEPSVAQNRNRLEIAIRETAQSDPEFSFRLSSTALASFQKELVKEDAMHFHHTLADLYTFFEAHNHLALTLNDLDVEITPELEELYSLRVVSEKKYEKGSSLGGAIDGLVEEAKTLGVLSKEPTWTEIYDHFSGILQEYDIADKIKANFLKEEKPRYAIVLSPFIISDNFILRMSAQFDKLFKGTALHQELSEFLAEGNTIIQKYKIIQQKSRSKYYRDHCSVYDNPPIPLTFVRVTEPQYNKTHMMQSFDHPFIQCKSDFLFKDFLAFSLESLLKKTLLEELFHASFFKPIGSQHEMLKYLGFYDDNHNIKPDSKESLSVFLGKIERSPQLIKLYQQCGFSHLQHTDSVLSVPFYNLVLANLLYNYSLLKNTSNLNLDQKLFLDTLKSHIRDFVTQYHLVVSRIFANDVELFPEPTMRALLNERIDLNQTLLTMNLQDYLNYVENRKQYVVTISLLDLSEEELHEEKDMEISAEKVPTPQKTSHTPVVTLYHQAVSEKHDKPIIKSTKTASSSVENPEKTDTVIKKVKYPP